MPKGRLQLNRRFVIERIPIQAFACIGEVVGATITEALNARVLTEVAALALMGIKLTTAGDVVRTLWRFGPDVDFDEDIYFEILWSTASTTSTHGVTWKLLYKTRVFTTQAPVAGDTALTDVMTAMTLGASATADALRSRVGKLAGGTIAQADTTGQSVDYLVLDVEADAFAGGLADAKVHGLNIWYLPRFGGVPGNYTGPTPIAVT